MEGHMPYQMNQSHPSVTRWTQPPSFLSFHKETKDIHILGSQSPVIARELVQHDSHNSSRLPSLSFTNCFRP